MITSWWSLAPVYLISIGSHGESKPTAWCPLAQDYYHILKKIILNFWAFGLAQLSPSLFDIWSFDHSYIHNLQHQHQPAIQPSKTTLISKVSWPASTIGAIKQSEKSGHKWCRTLCIVKSINFLSWIYQLFSPPFYLRMCFQPGPLFRYIHCLVPRKPEITS